MKFLILLLIICTVHAKSVKNLAKGQPKVQSSPKQVQNELKAEIVNEVTKQIKDELKQELKEEMLSKFAPHATFQRQGYIIGGSQASNGEYPWQVSLQQFFPGSHFCGGSYAGNGWVVTAAHCVDWIAANQVNVLLGTNDRTDTTNGIRIKARQIYIHQDWEGIESGFKGYPNDIAVIKLSSEPSGNNIEAISLAETGDFTGESCMITGWGDTIVGSAENYPIKLMEAEMGVISNTECASIWGRRMINDGHVCINSATRGSCGGDSGGPLQCQKRDGSWVLVGATSYGEEFCDTSYPSVYSRITYFHDWIMTTTNNLS